MKLLTTFMGIILTVLAYHGILTYFEVDFPTWLDIVNGALIGFIWGVTNLKKER